MESKNIKKYLSVAKKAALQSGNFLRHYKRDHLKVYSHKGKDIKISCDKEAEKIILSILKKETNISVLSEECGNFVGKNNNYTWIIDPLDGSFNFFRGIPYFCISIALFQGLNPILGVIYDFIHKELFVGIPGEGAWMNGKKIKSSQVKDIKNSVLATGFPTSSDFSRKGLMGYVNQVRAFKKVRLFGSAALSLANVACGRVDAYFEKSIKIWDVAAGLALVVGAGGIYNIKKCPGNHNYVVFASNKHLRGIIKI